MTAEFILKSFEELEIARDLTPEQIETLASMAFEVSFSEDQVIFREADVGELLYIIVDGQAAIDIFVPGQGRTTVLTVGPGQLLGWSSLFPSGRKTAGARTTTPTTAIAVNAAQLREAMQADHDLGCALLWRISEVIAGRLKATRLQLLDIFAHNTAN